MEIKIKRLHPDAVIPSYARHGDAGLDLTAVSKQFDQHGNVVYGTGLAFEIPEGYVGLIFPRSSVFKRNLLMANSVGVIDSGYRGEVMAKFVSTYSEDDSEYNIGERVAQMIIMPFPKIEFIETDRLSETERGDRGHGSTGA